ncbi:MAG: polyphosphate kinase 2 family protein [Vicinamibacterales bacterium]
MKNLTNRFRVMPRSRTSLAALDPCDTDGISKATAGDRLEKGIARLSDAQERLYALNTWSVLIIFQAPDAAGKDSTIKHVMSGVNPQGCQVFSFKAPSAEELDHDFLWRSAKALPERGRIGIHNRSYYEEVIVTRVHPGILERQQLPGKAGDGSFWQRRFDSINNFEQHLVLNGTLVLKFFLHISRDEQRKRFIERLSEPEKYWKFSPGDLVERQHWDDYAAAYESVFRETSTAHAPWFIVPADHKWFTRMAVAEIICDALEHLELSFPTVSKSQREEWATSRAALEAEDVSSRAPRPRRPGRPRRGRP